jgi:hypothetical protein
MTSEFEGPTTWPDPPSLDEPESTSPAPSPSPEGLLPMPPAPPDAVPAPSGRKNRRTVLVAAAVAAAVVGGIVAVVTATSGGGGTTAAPGTHGPAVVPAGWSVHRDADSGFAMAYPNAWLDLTEQVKVKVPEYSDYIKFAIADPSGTGRNVNVVVEDAPVVDLERYVEANKANLEEGSATDFAERATTLPAGPAVILSYNGGDTVNGARLVQYFLLGSHRAFVITFTPDATTQFDQALADQFMDSFELLD